MSLSDLGVFGLDKREPVTEEAITINATVYDIVVLDGLAKAVAHTACVHYNCCTGQHKVTNKGARAVPCRDLSYYQCHLEVCWSLPGALVSNG